MHLDRVQNGVIEMKLNLARRVPGRRLGTAPQCAHDVTEHRDFVRGPERSVDHPWRASAEMTKREMQIAARAREPLVQQQGSHVERGTRNIQLHVARAAETIDNVTHDFAVRVRHVNIQARRVTKTPNIAPRARRLKDAQRVARRACSAYM